MSAIHLIERENLFKRIGQGPEWESGYWAISRAEAETLVDGQIYFHERQLEPSFYGGEITGFRVQADGEYGGRVVFRFAPKPECRGVRAGADGWQYEKKIVR